jgi:hypothetical protein
MGFEYWFVGPESADGEQRMFCPICENPETSSSPSAMLNAGQAVWNCLKGDHGGPISTLIKRMKSHPHYQQNKPARKKAASGKEPPSAVAVATWHALLMQDEDLLDEFCTKRAISQDSVEEYEIGYDPTSGRFTIPIYDERGNLVNVRKYLMGAGDNDQKFWNHPGHGDARIFQSQELANTDWVILAEGELDCIVLLDQGFPAVSGTGGSGVFKPEWAEGFTDKAVYVAYDADDAGDKGAVKVANVLRNFATVVYRVRLPEQGMDVTDFFAAGGSADKFESLLSAAKRAGSRASRALEEAPKSGMALSLLESMSDRSQGQPIELTVSVVGKGQEPYTAPRRIVASCDMQKGAPCERCPLMARNGEMEVITQPHDPRLIQFVDVPGSTAHRLLRMMTGARCGDHVEFDVQELWRVEEMAVQPSVDDRSDANEDRPVKRTVWSVGTYKTGTNEKMRFVGANVPDPRTGVLKFHAWRSDKVELDIDKFRLTEGFREQLEIFQPDDRQSSLDKCIEIATDLSASVTRIVGRPMLHVAMDLVYHSPIAFRVGEVEVDKGWLEMMVVGDTRTGKSEIATRLMNYYRSGRLISCEGATFAGLIGGVQQIGNRWHMTWGIVPMNDRRLVILDEVSGMGEKNIIEQMSSVRSAGVAQITKIATESTSARTRLIWITNPQSGAFLEEHRSGGIGALQSVVKNNEDIARFDFVMAAARGDVAPEEINRIYDADFATYSAEDCELLVRWAWSQTRDTVFVSETAVKYAAESAVKLGRKYSPHPPLIQAENVRFKLLRIAAAIAGRTFSVGKSGGLRVLREHVQSAVEFLDEIYGQESLGYGRMSSEESERERRSESMAGNAKQLMMQHPEVLATLHMSSGEFKVRDFSEFQGLPESEASRVVATLVQWGLVKYTGSRGIFSMTAQLIALVRQMKEQEDG